MNELIKQEDIEKRIYTIRGVEVMFDFDLAKIYDVETKRINESAKRNQIKFPEKFSWVLTDDESNNSFIFFVLSSTFSSNNITLFSKTSLEKLK